MSAPQQGYLQFKDQQWSFLPGRNKTKNPIPLHNFPELAYSMVNNKKLFDGWKSKNHVLTARFSRITSNVLSNLIVNGKVSAKNLTHTNTPTLLQHHKLNQTDKQIWDAAYLAEYQGLENIDTWEVIDENQYQQIKHLCKGILPTMAITTIKTDKNGNPESDLDPATVELQVTLIQYINLTSKTDHEDLQLEPQRDQKTCEEMGGVRGTQTP